VDAVRIPVGSKNNSGINAMQKSLQVLAAAVALTLAQASSATPAEQKCSHPTNDCTTRVVITRPTAGKPCQASIGQGKITVGLGAKPRHVWKIVKAPNDKGQYEWDIPNGIEIIKDNDHQVLNKGVNKDGNFWIKNANTVPGSEIEYIAHVRLILNNTDSQMCDSVDPRIVNALR
jgi:hypothetical protein